MRSSLRPLFAAALGSLVAASACNDTPSTAEFSNGPGQAGQPGSIRLLIDNNPSAGVIISQKTASLVYGTGVFLKAQVVDVNGQPVQGARASWRSTNTAVALTNVLADSTSSSGDWGRTAVVSIGPGTAFVIASYQGIADTAVITVTPRPDAAPAAPRPTEFNVTVRVFGFVASAPAADSASRYPRIAGAQVTLTLLPLLAGDSVAAGTTLVRAPVVAAVLATDANGLITFTNIPATRYSLSVEPPAGSDWAAGSVSFGPSFLSSTSASVMLNKK